MPRIQERSILTRERLLEATLDVLVERGYAGASTPEICKRAGTSRGAMLHHYPTRTDLMAGAVEHLLQVRHAEFRSRFVTRQPIDLDEGFEALWEIYSGTTLHAWMELVVASRTDAELYQAMFAVNARFTAEAEETFRQLFDVPDDVVTGATRLLLATLDGLALNRVLEPDDALAHQTLETLKYLIRPWVRN